MGTALHLPITRSHTIHQSTVKTNLSRLYHRVRCHVGRILGGHHKCTIVGWEYIYLSESLCFGILRLPIDRIGIHHCLTAIHMARNAVVGFDLVGTGIFVGNASILHFRGSVCKERTTIVGVVSGIFLLLAFGMADSIVLAKRHYFIGSNIEKTLDA